MAAAAARLTRWQRRFRALVAIIGATLLAVTPAAGPRPAPDGGPRRIVSLVPAVTEMFFAIGVDDRVVGVSSYDRFPPAVDRLPRLGGLLDPNVEGLLGLAPDLVVLYGTQSDLRRQLERAGISVFVYTHRDLADVTATLRAIGARVGAGARAESVAGRIEHELTEVGRQVQGRPRPRTLLVIGHEPHALRQLQASGGYGFLHDLLVLAGAEDAVGDLKRESVGVSLEMLLARSPEVILDLHYGVSLSAERLEAERQLWRRVSAVTAVKTGRVHVLAGDEFVVPGPRVVLAARQLARTLHP